MDAVSHCEVSCLMMVGEASYWVAASPVRPALGMLWDYPAWPRVFLLVALAQGAGSGCKAPSKDARQQGAAPTSQSLRLGFLLKTMQEERYAHDRDLFREHGRKLGAEVLFGSANNDEALQWQQLERMLQRGCRVVVLQPVNTGRARPLVQMAHRHGAKVLGYDSMPVNTPLDLMVMQDSWAVGRLQAEALVEWLQKKRGRVRGGLVLIQGQPGDSNASALSSGVIEIVAQYPDLKLLAAISHLYWSPARAKETVAGLLAERGDAIDAFIANNSGLARGVIEAIEEAGLAAGERFFVAGADADLLNLRYLTQGKQNVEVLKSIRPLAEKAAELAVQLARNETIKGGRWLNNGYTNVRTFVTPVALITRENLDETILATGLYSRSQIYAAP
jgi:D-xylose transport system substrate-binding protein